MKDIEAYTNTKIYKVLGVKTHNSKVYAKAEQLFFYHTFAKDYAVELERQGFQVMFELLPFSEVESYGDSLITEIEELYENHPKGLIQ